MKKVVCFNVGLQSILLFVVLLSPVVVSPSDSRVVSLFDAILPDGDDFVSDALPANAATQDTLLNNIKANEQDIAAMYAQAQNYTAAGNFDMAIATYEELLKQSPNYKDARAKLQTVRDQFEARQLADRLESEYAIGLALLKAHDWTRAVITFEKVLEMDRTFREARRRLAEAKRGLEKESTEIITARYYADGIASMNQNDLGRALAAFDKVKSINPEYRDVAKLMAEIDGVLGDKNRGMSPAGLDSLYQLGVAAQEKLDWLQAVLAFEKVEVLQPNFKDVAGRLALSRRQLSNTGSAVSAAPWSSPLYVGAAMVGLVVIPLLGAVVFSPNARARYHLLRGRYAEAVSIYERLLARKPDRVKLYPALANLYLLMGRHDERAMKIYKMVLQLNLATSNREEINANVAQHYLSEGRTDSDAIEVLENLLKSEQRKHGKIEHKSNSGN